MSPIIKDFLQPIHVRIQIRIFAGNRITNLVFRIFCSNTVITHCLVSCIHISDTVCQINHLRETGKRFIIIRAHCRFPHLSRFGFNQNHTISASHTIHSRCRCIFQCCQRFNVFRIDVVERTFHSIHQYQRRRSVGSRNTTNPDISGIFTRFSRTLHGYNTGQTTCQRCS